MKKIILILFALLAATVVRAQITKDASAKDKLLNAFYNSGKLIDMQQIYTELIEKFPEKGNSTIGSYDELKRVLSINYLFEGDTVNYKKYVLSVKDKVMLAEYFNSVASHTKPKDSIMLNRILIASALSVKLNKQFSSAPARYKPANYTLPEWKKQISKQNEDYTYTYAYVLYSQQRYKEALQYIEPLYTNLTEPNDKVTEFYSILLRETNEQHKAIKVIENAIAAGYQSESIFNELRKDYLTIHGENADFDQYLTNLKNTFKEKFISRIKATMINEPAPAFSLKDLGGKTVSLNELKGKTVIVDFWATWCAPCKASFPGMQLAVNKYKGDDQVKFLFIDTRENGKDYITSVKKYIADSKYTFHVLLDENDASGKQTKIVNAFNVDGIPTKFIIDKSGHIRFKSVGYIGSDKDILETMSTMIDLSSGQ